MTDDANVDDVLRDRYLTVPEVAKKLRLSKMTVYRMIRRSELDAARFGHSFRIRESSLRSYLRGAFQDDF